MQSISNDVVAEYKKKNIKLVAPDESDRPAIRFSACCLLSKEIICHENHDASATADYKTHADMLRAIAARSEKQLIQQEADSVIMEALESAKQGHSACTVHRAKQLSPQALEYLSSVAHINVTDVTTVFSSSYVYKVDFVRKEEKGESAEQ